MHSDPDRATDVTAIHPPIQPYERGMLAVGDGNLVYWETCGNPRGKPAVVVHGGPGSGCTDWQRRLFDPDAYRVVLTIREAADAARPMRAPSITSCRATPRGI